MVEANEGIAEIDAAKWVKDDTGTLNLFVHDRDGKRILAWMRPRPPCCDRGHVQVDIDGVHGMDWADSFPRYFFSVAEADQHTRTFLKWRLLWKERTHPPTFEAP